MKLEDMAFAVVQRVFGELEHAHHFVVPEAVRRAVAEAVRKDLGRLIK